MRAPTWWPFELVYDPAETMTPCLVVYFPRRLLFLWWDRRPRALLGVRS